MTKKEYDVKALAQDGMFSALCVVVILLFSLISNNWKIYCFSLVVLLSIFYCSKPLYRALISSVVIFAVSFIVANPLNVLIFVLPNCLIGAFSSKIVNTKFKFTLPILFMALASYEAFVYPYVFLGKNIFSYFKDVISGVNPDSSLLIIGDNQVFLILMIACFLLAIVVVETIVYFLMYKILGDRISKFLS